MALKRAVLVVVEEMSCLSTFSTDTTSQLDVFGHDGDTLGVDGAQVGVFEKSDQVSLASLLEGHDSRALEPQVGLEILGDFTDETLEWEFPDEELGALLVPTDFSESYCSGPVPVGFLYSSGGWCTLTSGFGSQLFTWSLSSSGFTGSLLCTSHLSCFPVEVQRQNEESEDRAIFVLPATLQTMAAIGCGNM